MNIMNHLTKKHMWMNKKRTIMTIFGVIISVAMITAVATAAATFIDLLKRREIDIRGKWHIMLSDVSADMKDGMYNIPNIDDLYQVGDMGYGKPVNLSIENVNKPFMYLKAFDKKAMDHMSIKLVEGRYPQAKYEILISEHLLSNGKVKVKVGDDIELDLGERYIGNYDKENVLTQENAFLVDVKEEYKVNERVTYTVVGIMERSDMESYSAPGYLAITYLYEEMANDPNQIFHMYAYFNKISKDFYNDIDTFTKNNQINETQLNYHHRLLVYYGSSRFEGITLVIQGLGLLLLIIIMVGSISLIYNSFAISITERKKQFGMLASIGTTKRQIRNSIFYEGAVIGGIAIPLGILAGIGGMYVTFSIVGPTLVSAIGFDVPIYMRVSMGSIIIAVVFSIVTILVSAYIPAMTAARISPLDAIRQSKDIKLNKKGLRVNKLSQKIFGVEGTLAIKNLRRNKKRFNTLVFSLFISFVLFTSVGSYVFYLSKTVEMTHSDYPYDYAISTPVTELTDEIYNELKQLESVNAITQVQELNYSVTLDKEFVEEKITEEFTELYYQEQRKYGRDESIIKEDFEYYKETIYIELIAMNEESYKEFRKELNLKENNINSKPKAILLNSFTTSGNVNKMEADMLDIKVGEQVTLNHPVYDYNSVNENDEALLIDNITYDIEVEAVTDHLPYGINRATLHDSYKIIISEKDLIHIKEDIASHYEDDIRFYKQYYLDIKDNKYMEDNVKLIMNKHGITEYYETNYYENSLREQQMITTFSVFAYGFITLISLICVTNLCNTISTSFSLRRREFAMLKSMGMVQRDFLKMIYLESTMYGVKALLFGIPIGIFITLRIFSILSYNFTFGFEFPLMIYAIGLLFVVGVVGVAVLYSSRKIKKESIILGLKSELNE